MVRANSIVNAQTASQQDGFKNTSISGRGRLRPRKTVL